MLSFSSSASSKSTKTSSSAIGTSSYRAPSFYSAVESFSERPPTTPRRRVMQHSTSPTRTNTTSGSRGSLHMPSTPSGKGYRHFSLEMTARPLGVVLASPFTKPQFSLDNVEPNLCRVPKLETAAGNLTNSTRDHLEVNTDWRPPSRRRW